MNLPRRRKSPRMGLRESSVIRCPGHLQWTRGNLCVVRHSAVSPDCYVCVNQTHAHHVKTKGAGGGDEQVVAMCSIHHSEIHNIGVETFEKKYGINLADEAANGWLVSPHGIRYRREHGK